MQDNVIYLPRTTSAPAAYHAMRQRLETARNQLEIGDNVRVFDHGTGRWIDGYVLQIQMDPLTVEPVQWRALVATGTVMTWREVDEIRRAS